MVVLRKGIGMDKEQTPQENKVAEVVASKPAPASTIPAPTKKKYTKELDRAIFLTLVVISIAVIVTVFFSNSELDEYSKQQEITLEGVSIPTISAVVGERRVRTVEINVIPNTIGSKIFLFEAIGDRYDISDEDLVSYAHHLIENESFLPLSFDGISMDFALVRAIDEGYLLTIKSSHEVNEVMIEYVITVNAEVYDQIDRFKHVEILFREFGLDARALLLASNGLNEIFWEFATEAAMTHRGVSETAAGEPNGLLDRYLEIVWTE